MSAQTAEDGQFCFDMFPEGTKLYLEISKEGYATYCSFQLSEELYCPEKGAPNLITGKMEKISYPKGIFMNHVTGMKDVEFILKPQACVQGIVKDKYSETPLANIPLSLFLDNGTGYPATFHPIIPCKTDPEGRFSFCGLTKGIYTLSFKENGHSYAKDHLQINLSEGQKRKNVVFELTHGGTLDLELRDASSQQPIGGCKIYLETPDYPHSSAPYCMVQTDNNGRYIQNLTPGTYKINAFEKTGYGCSFPQSTYKFSGRVLCRHVFEISDGQKTPLSLELTENPKTRVIVKDPNGNPVRNLRIRIINRQGEHHYEEETWHNETPPCRYLVILTTSVTTTTTTTTISYT